MGGFVISISKNFTKMPQWKPTLPLIQFKIVVESFDLDHKLISIESHHCRKISPIKRRLNVTPNWSPVKLSEFIKWRMILAVVNAI